MSPIRFLRKIQTSVEEEVVVDHQLSRCSFLLLVRISLLHSGAGGFAADLGRSDLSLASDFAKMLEGSLFAKVLLAFMLLHSLHGGLLVAKGREHEGRHVKLFALSS